MRLPRRALFVGAHCDDVELMAGGLLHRLCATPDAEVGVLVFSDHRGVLDDARAAQARDEFRDNLAWLRETTGRAVRDHSGPMLPACRGAFEARRGEVYAALEALRGGYDLVVTHAEADTNQDHRQVAAECLRVFKSHATLLGGEFPNNDVGGFGARVLVALTEADVAAKARMVSRYRSQDLNGRPYLDPAVWRALAVVRGAQVRCPYAEGFDLLGRVVVAAP